MLRIIQDSDNIFHFKISNNFRLKDELENEIPKYGRKLLQFQHRLEHFKGICFFCKASCVHPSNLCPVIKRLDVRRKFLDSHPDFCRLVSTHQNRGRRSEFRFRGPILDQAMNRATHK
ncbi:hypothetical protein WR25_11422 [Diploscapter pachys]|uniref:Uncharacterized protein n=1 Tax=Diploscapter pachys TaxID=2018661 RepID=A0A2A2KPL6_9BILA|nr:hypothetical protein WR25_11422 [Diploscapter pachys]